MPQNDAAALWTERAPRFPSGRDPGHRARMLARLTHVPQAALPRTGMRCLDVGAGTGVFALYASDEGADVTATDVSEGMLARLSANDPERRVTAVRADWKDIDPEAHGWTGGFDLALAQFVERPAVCEVVRRQNGSRRRDRSSERVPASAVA